VEALFAVRAESTSHRHPVPKRFLAAAIAALFAAALLAGSLPVYAQSANPLRLLGPVEDASSPGLPATAGSPGGARPSSAESPARPLDASPGDASDSEAARAADLLMTAEAIAERRDELAREIAQLEAATARHAPEDRPSSDIQILGYLQYLESVYAQQQVVLDSERELRDDFQGFQRERTSIQLLGNRAAHSYTFAALEQLRDRRDDSQMQCKLAESESQAMQAFVESVREQYAGNERQRRQVMERLERERDPVRHADLTKQLRILELRRRIGDQLLALREQGLRVNELKANLARQRTEFLDKLIPAVEAVVRFPEEDLAQLLARTDADQQALNQQLATMQKDLREVDVLAMSFTSNDLTETSDGETVKVIRRSLNRGIAQANESFATILQSRYVWKSRYRLHNRLATPEELVEMRADVDQLLDRVKNAEEALLASQQEARLEVDAVNRRQVTRVTKQLGELRTKVLSDGFKLAGARQRLLRGYQRILARLDDELSARIQTRRTQLTWERLGPLARSWWYTELFVVEDRPVTIGKLVTGILLLIGGYLVSGVASRLIGHRLLPRVGVHPGASLAAQTISFYAMMLVFGIGTLDALNIPITALTIFGGAIAIGVGFGSQNILNNFISGLIILGEQPIRVGDLIEVDGLHGTIEHIGARSTRVRTGRNFEIIIPNSKFLENNVKNLTRTSNDIRTMIRIGVAYGSDVELVMRLLREVTLQQSYVLQGMEPIVLFGDFGDNSLMFEVHFWVRMRTQMDSLRAESALRVQMERAFREANVTIAYPQRDVHLDVAGPLEVRVAPADSLPSMVRRAA
jgi:small-conductance mechanosensitive channel